MVSEFSKNVIKLIQNIPVGKVLTYGRIAKLAGNPQAARQVSWILHSSTRKYDLPWHRVINSKGLIALKAEVEKLDQKVMLEKEGVKFSEEFKIDLGESMWKIDSIDKVKVSK
ncbi:MAG: MGMT family protein [Candidatus Lokiarchaeota archaeon]|jgi:methylated-DNA-protein-cysteine methyltransferase-like protein